MTRNGQVAIFFPLVAGSFAALCTVLIHSFALGAAVNLFRHERRLGRVGSARIHLGISALAILFAFVAHLVGPKYRQLVGTNQHHNLMLK